MPSDAVIDIEQLLAPIEGGENPAGKDLANTTVLTELRELRRQEEEDNLGDWAVKEAGTPGWPKILKLATSTLTNESKDLRVAGFLVEAITRQFGMPGLRDGLMLLRELQTRYWDNFYPLLHQPPPEADEDGYMEEEESGIELRAAALGQIDRQMPMAIRKTRATKAQLSTTFYSHIDWDQANYLDNLKVREPKAYDEAVAEGKPTGELFKKAVAQTPRSFYENWIQDLDACHEQLRLLNEYIESMYGDAEEMPTLSNITRTMEQLEEMVGDIEKTTGPLRDKPAEEGEGGAGEGGAEGEGGGTGGGGAQRRAFVGDGVPLDPVDRQDAIRRLQAVASYFHRNEPHSPIGYLVERAIYWSSLPFEKWLEEVVKDDSVLGHVRETLGIKPPEEPSGY